MAGRRRKGCCCGPVLTLVGSPVHPSVWMYLEKSGLGVSCLLHLLKQPLVISMLVRNSDKRISCDEEFSDSEDEGEGGRKNVANFKKAKRVKTEEEKEEEEKKGEQQGQG